MALRDPKLKAIAGRHVSGTLALMTGTRDDGPARCAHDIADELGVPLVHVDLARVVSKYIGETEKHIDQVFAGAAQMRAVLFFDEADALFGKRTDVRDAHDRYANIEISYLLERVKAYCGIVILAADKPDNVDEALITHCDFVLALPHDGCR